MTMTTSLRVASFILGLSLLGIAGCRDDNNAPGNTGGAGGRGGSGGTGGTGGTAGRGGSGGTGGTAGRGGSGGTGGTGGGGVDAPADTAADTTGGDGSSDLSAEAAGDVPDSAPMEAGTDTPLPVDASGDTPANAMTFFVSSTGSGVMGGNLGGLAGADAKCEALAAAVGAGGRGWKAFLSAEPGSITPAVNAKDRIGGGPWRNQRGQMIAANVASLLASPPAANLMVDEKGGAIPNDWHEVLTGTRADGTVYTGRTCTSWTVTTGSSQTGIATDPDPSQRFSSHIAGCTQAALEAVGNQGRIYCFAATP